MLRPAPVTVNDLAGDGGVAEILYKDMVSHERAIIDREFSSARDNGASMQDALAIEDRAYKRLNALKTAVKQNPNTILAKDYRTGHFVVADGVIF